MTDTWNRKSIALPAGVLLLLLLVAVGCSGGGSPASPDIDSSRLSDSESSPGQSGGDSRVSWGLWNITVDAEALTAEVVPLRGGQIHYNVLHMLETWACKDCVTVDWLYWSPDQKLMLDISIRHPYEPDRLDLTGRDVRGVAIFEGTTSFPAHKIKTPDGTLKPILASRRLLNADGYTSHFNRWTAEEGTHLLDYVRGRFAPPGEVNIKGNLHPFIYFYTHEYKRLFYPSYSVQRTYELDVHKYEYFTFGYSVDASWNLPMDWPVTNPITDFNISTNCLEPYQISMSITDNQLTRQGGFCNMDIDIFDHQGVDTISTIEIEAPDLFTGVQYVDPSASVAAGDDWARYQVTVNNTTGHAKTADGGSDLLVVAEDISQSVVGQDVRAYNIFVLPVKDTPADWRPRDGTFENLPFPGSDPSGNNVDMAVVRDPAAPWAINPGEPMLLFNDDSQERYLACSRNFDEWMIIAGYPGSPFSWMLPTRRMDATASGGLGVLSDSDYPVDDYLVRHCTNAHVPGGVYARSWYTGSLSDPDVHFEVAGDVSGGFGKAIGDPIYTVYLYESGTQPIYQSLHRIETPYNDPMGIRRAFVALSVGLSGNAPPYGVSGFLVAMDADDEPVGELNPYTIHAYTAENRETAPGTHARELDVWHVNFSEPWSPYHMRTYHDALLGQSLLVPVIEDPRLVDVTVLPAGTDNIYMGDDTFAQHNWVAVLYAFDLWERWFIEIFDAQLEDPLPTSWQLPLYTIGPYYGNAFAVDCDPESFELYVLHDDSPLGTGALRLTCLEYY